VKGEEKMGGPDVLEIFRDTYQDTPFDMTRSLTTVTKDGKAVKSPVANPFMSNDYLQLFNVTSERTIACKRATYLQITQSRGWLPNPIGGLVWLGYDNPTTTPHIPFYIGIMIVLASLANAVQAVWHRSSFADRIFLDRHRLERIATFFVLVTAFVALSAVLGLYVAAVIYVLAATWWQGGYRPWIGAACGVTAALFFYVVLEKGFQVPLLKGPLEAALGIY